MVDAGVFHIMGQSNLEFPIDRQRCARWGVSVADVQDVIATAVGGKSVSQMIEGERSFDIALRWPERLRGDESAILNIPVDVSRNVVSSGTAPSLSPTPVTGPAGGAFGRGQQRGAAGRDGRQRQCPAERPEPHAAPPAGRPGDPAGARRPPRSPRARSCSRARRRSTASKDNA